MFQVLKLVEGELLALITFPKPTKRLNNEKAFVRFEVKLSAHETRLLLRSLPTGISAKLSARQTVRLNFVVHEFGDEQLLGAKTALTLDPDKLPDAALSELGWTRGFLPGQTKGDSSSSPQGGVGGPSVHAGPSESATDAGSAGTGSGSPSPG